MLIDSNNHNNGYWSNNGNRLNVEHGLNYRSIRRANAQSILFPDAFEDLKLRQNFNPNFNRNRPQGNQGFRQFGGQFVPQQQQQQQPQQPRVLPAAQPGLPTGYYQCMNGCLSTSEYNPVCGSNDMTYPNIQRLNCANRCGMSKFKISLNLERNVKYCQFCQKLF